MEMAPWRIALTDGLRNCIECRAGAQYAWTMVAERQLAGSPSGRALFRAPPSNRASTSIVDAGCGYRRLYRQASKGVDARVEQTDEISVSALLFVVDLL